MSVASGLVGTFTPTRALDVDGDFRFVGDAPIGQSIRGAFVSAIFTQLDDDERRAVLTTLSHPPRLGAFVPFTLYPQSDYHRIVRKVAEKLVPSGAPIAEGLRCAARADFATFGASSFGKVVMAMVGDAKSALLRTPGVYTTVAPGPGTITATVVDERRVRLEFAGYTILWPYQLGQLEGMVEHFGTPPETVVEELTDGSYAYTIRHRA